MGRRSQYSFSKRQRELRKKKKKEEKLAKKHGRPEDEEAENENAEVVEEESSEPEVVDLSEFVDGFTPELDAPDEEKKGEEADRKD